MVEIILLRSPDFIFFLRKKPKFLSEGLRKPTTSIITTSSGGASLGSDASGGSGAASPNNEKAPFWKYRDQGFDRWKAELVLVNTGCYLNS